MAVTLFSETGDEISDGVAGTCGFGGGQSVEYCHIAVLTSQLADQVSG
jgi:hypothetical protein